MTVTLVLSGELATELHAAAREELETAGVLLARIVHDGEGDFRLLGREIRWVPADGYMRREPDGLTIASHGYVDALGRAEATDTVPIWLHTHPGEGSRPVPSEHDDVVDEALRDVFRIRSGSDYYGTLIVSPAGRHLRFTGRLESDDQRSPIDRTWVTGSTWWLVHNSLHEAPEIDEQFDRNVRAFGGAVQQALADLTVAVVGTGGTGSAASEQLARLGVRNFILVDPDELSLSNVTRVYGSSPSDVGRPKVEVVADHLQRISPDANVRALRGSIVHRDIAVQLLGADVIFGCTDDNAGRLILSRIATYLLTPVIDCGVLITSDAGEIAGIDARVTVMTPGAACLVCRNRIDLRRAAAETMTAAEHERLAGEGYAPALVGTEPAVVAFTTHVAAAAVEELLERLIHYGRDPAPSELLLRIHERETSTNDAAPRDRHYCHRDQGKWGLGMTEPFLEQTWPE